MDKESFNSFLELQDKIRETKDEMDINPEQMKWRPKGDEKERYMTLLEGIPISPGYASGTAVVYDYEIERLLKLPPGDMSTSTIDSEFKRLDDALERTRQDLDSVEQTVLNEPSLHEFAPLLSAHSAMAKEITSLVKQHVARLSWSASMLYLNDLLWLLRYRARKLYRCQNLSCPSQL